jgi:hypothetical protein
MILAIGMNIRSPKAQWKPVLEQILQNAIAGNTDVIATIKRIIISSVNPSVLPS